MYDGNTIRTVLMISTLVLPGSVYAQGSAGTGNVSTGIGSRTGPAGPGIQPGGWTQQPGVATNNGRSDSNLTPAQRNSIPPPSTRGYRK
jgi:hypothetical protein